jgi:hypothetical protein
MFIHCYTRSSQSVVCEDCLLGTKVNKQLSGHVQPWHKAPSTQAKQRATVDARMTVTMNSMPTKAEAMGHALTAQVGAAATVLGDTFPVLICKPQHQTTIRQEQMKHSP